jgi:hypothetical protein
MTPDRHPTHNRQCEMADSFDDLCEPCFQAYEQAAAMMPVNELETA